MQMRCSQPAGILHIMTSIGSIDMGMVLAVLAVLIWEKK